MTYLICKVDPSVDDNCLPALHMWTFGEDAPKPNFDRGDWWIACTQQGDPVAFAGLIKSTIEKDAGYFYRVGVLPLHRGNGLQQRLQKVCEERAKALGLTTMVSDTTDNIPSANNLIAAGYRLYKPQAPWAFEHTLYWRKTL